jgi:hypothetical protein
MNDDETLSAFRPGASSARLIGGYEPRSLAERSGEHRLMLAILEDAVAVFVKSLCGGAVKNREVCAARVWLESRDRMSPFTFESICDLLGLDSGYIRHGLRNMRARPAAAAARLAARHSGRPSGPPTSPRTVPVMALRRQ